jgi:hypothetical protein
MNSEFDAPQARVERLEAAGGTTASGSSIAFRLEPPEDALILAGRIACSLSHPSERWHQQQSMLVQHVWVGPSAFGRAIS